jgi:integrase
VAVADTWFRRDGSPSVHHGEGNRWRIRWQGESRSFPDQRRNRPPSPSDRPPRNVEAAWARMLTAEQRKQSADATVSDLLDRWLALKEGLSPGGYAACRTAAAHVRAYWGHRPASMVGFEEVQRWLNGLQVERKRGGKTEVSAASPSLKHKVLTCLKGALELDGQRISGGKVKLPAQKRRPAAWLEPDDLARLAAECKGYESLVWTLGTTGLRIGEACALNVGDVTRKSGRLQVRESKSGEPRSVPVPARVLAMYDLDRPAGEPLFLSVKGHRVNKDNFRNLYFRPALKRAGLTDVWIHGLRHVAASLAIAGGADVKNVQNMLGHKDATMTLNTYAERWDEGLDDVARRMDNMFGGDDE